VPAPAVGQVVALAPAWSVIVEADLDLIIKGAVNGGEAKTDADTLCGRIADLLCCV
jgi:hypothetical protein